MHIRKIQIANIRCFPGDDQRVDIDLARPDGRHAGWTVFAGPNGSGKSTLLKTIALAALGPSAARALEPSFAGWIRHGAAAADASVEIGTHPTDALEGAGHRRSRGAPARGDVPATPCSRLPFDASTSPRVGRDGAGSDPVRNVRNFGAFAPKSQGGGTMQRIKDAAGTPERLDTRETIAVGSGAPCSSSSTQPRKQLAAGPTAQPELAPCASPDAASPWPMLKYVSSNLFDSPAQTLVNTVNVVGVMGKGIAAEFKRRYPDMFRRYAEHCKSGSLDIGKLYLYRTANKLILNFPTKKHWRHPSKLEYIEAGLKKFVDTYAAHGIVSISFPQLGCGNGGLPWSEVQPLMQRYLSRLPIPVYIHLAAPKSDFVPEHLKPGARLEALRSRRGVGFEEVWRGLWRAAGMPGEAPEAHKDTFDELLPSITVESHGRTVELPGEDIEALWTSLRLRGALPQTEFPGALRSEADAVRELLLKLDFLQPIQFVFDDVSGRRREPGIRFAPEADAVLPGIAVPERVE